jgi:hypothetical protein
MLIGRRVAHLNRQALDFGPVLTCADDLLRDFLTESFIFSPLLPIVCLNGTAVPRPEDV